MVDSSITKGTDDSLRLEIINGMNRLKLEDDPTDSKIRRIPGRHSYDMLLGSKRIVNTMSISI
jgi:hypothetical protein